MIQHNGLAHHWMLLKTFWWFTTSNCLQNLNQSMERHFYTCDASLKVADEKNYLPADMSIQFLLVLKTFLTTDINNEIHWSKISVHGSVGIIMGWCIQVKHFNRSINPLNSVCNIPFIASVNCCATTKRPMADQDELNWEKWQMMFI